MTCFWVGRFPAIRLAVMDEPESEEEVIYNQEPVPPQRGWSLDSEDSDPEGTQRHHESRHKNKCAANARSKVAFSSLLVG